MRYMYLGCLEKPCIIIHCNAGLGMGIYALGLRGGVNITYADV